MASPYVEREAASTRTEADAERDRMAATLERLKKDRDELRRSAMTPAGGDRYEAEVDALRYAIAAIEREKELREVAQEVVTDLESLASESEGVAGLHLNGDIAPWSELRAGGRYEEWLVSVDRLATALRTQGGSHE